MALIAAEVAVIRPWRPALPTDSSPKLSRCCVSAPSAGACSAFRFEKVRRMLRSEDVPGDGELESSKQQPGEFDFLYKVQLVTSTRPKSGFSEFSGRVSLVLIGEDGKCVLRFLEAASGDSQKLRFQKGDVDVFEFIAPDLGPLRAMWIGPSRGSWRLEEATVTVTSRKAAPKGDPAVYVFQTEGELLGDRGDVPAIELRPVGWKNQVSFPQEIRETWMKEYERLKASLLLWDAALVALGSGLLYTAGYKEIALTFAIGGAAGFFYLFLLQGAVDQIGKEGGNILTAIKQPAGRLGLVVAFVFVVAKTLELQGNADWSDPLTKEEFLGGTAGLLVYKAALILATIKE